MHEDPVRRAAQKLMNSIQRMLGEPRDAAAFASHAADHLTELAHAIADEAAEKARGERPLGDERRSFPPAP
ncbi:MAG: hypothetical protein HYV09_33540 [Deltaproteobacteria bacterium]|nr:hypothetical protein [Deltaproteobacteria bacterium]